MKVAHPFRGRTQFAIFTLLCVFATTGCTTSGNSPRDDMKRDHDRAMLKLSKTEKQRDDYKTQLDAMRKSLNDAEARANSAPAKPVTAPAPPDKSESLKRQVAEMQQNLDALRRERDTLRAELQKLSTTSTTSRPATRSSPELNK